MNIEDIIRPNIRNLKAYSSARDEYKGKEGIFLDANENSIGSTAGEGLNRYPDPLQKDVKAVISEIKNINSENIFLGNGSDEAIDILYRIFCVPGVSNIIVCPPTYGMYEVSANINDVEVKKVYLNTDFHLNFTEILKIADKNTRIIFICSPNNPTANLMHKKDIEYLLNNFNGVVVVDEAYIDFCRDASLLPELEKHPNLIILQTLSKAWGAANIRLGMAYASSKIISYFNKVKPPYNINGVTQKIALDALKNFKQQNDWTEEIITEKKILIQALKELLVNAY